MMENFLYSKFLYRNNIIEMIDMFYNAEFFNKTKPKKRRKKLCQ